MKNKKVKQLICSVIDQTASAEEARELSDYIMRHPGAGEMYEEQKQMSQWLDDIPQVNPPAGLQDQIITALPARSKISNVRTAWWQRILPAPVLLPKHRFAFGFAGGIAVGLVFFFVLLLTNGPNTLKKESLLGTALFSRHFQVQRIDLPSVTGEVAWHSEQQGKMVRLTLNPGQPVTAEFIFDPAEFRVSHYYQEAWSSGGEVLVQPGRLQIDFNEENSFVLILAVKGPAESAVQFNITHQGALVYARRLYDPLSDQE
ncbi:hypothetical protein JXO59_09905 [candidate division KSB1 bacterium]|nr:hypothetical protein [candidate division KSB1 bacterium]